MAPIPAGGVVAVTGAAGYIGGWIVKLLLDKGYRVKACVRDADDEKSAFLRRMPGYFSGRLTLHSCDIRAPSAFDNVFPGCHGVVHAAADLDWSKRPELRDPTSKVAGQHDLPAVYEQSCQIIIDAIIKSKTVGRLIYTSSIAAVMDEVDIHEYTRRPVLYEDRYPDEANPKRQSLQRNGYSVAKVQAERYVAKAASQQNGHWDVIIALPACTVGPILSKHQGFYSWQDVIGRIMEGKRVAQMGGYGFWSTVDVRDCAEGHIRLLESAKVQSGERYIMWSTDTPRIEDIVKGTARVLPKADIDPARQIVDTNSPEVQKHKSELKQIWSGVQLRNDRIRTATGQTFRPLEQSLRDCVESLITIAERKPRVRSNPGSKL